MQIASYLMFEGQCREAFTAYESILGGRIEAMMNYAEMPPGNGPAPEQADLVMHACLKLGDQMLMASDAPPGQSEGPMRSVSVYVGVQAIPDAERIFAALSEGGEVKMPLAETFWAPRFGMLRDRFGTSWMISAEPEQACLPEA
jgi:PhnB protein